MIGYRRNFHRRDGGFFPRLAVSVQQVMGLRKGSTHPTRWASCSKPFVKWRIGMFAHRDRGLALNWKANKDGRKDA